MLNVFNASGHYTPKVRNMRTLAHGSHTSERRPNFIVAFLEVHCRRLSPHVHFVLVAVSLFLLLVLGADMQCLVALCKMFLARCDRG